MLEDKKSEKENTSIKSLLDNLKGSQSGIQIDLKETF